MRRFIFYSLTLTLLLGSMMTSCHEKTKKSGRTDTPTSGMIEFAADESFSPIIDEELQVFEAAYPKAKLTPIYTDEIKAINMLLGDSVHLVIISRKFSKEEYDHLKAKDRQPVAIPIAYDGLALICNNQNTDTCIAAKDVKRILRGEVKTWDEIHPNSKRGEIWVCFDNKSSSTVHYCIDSLLNGEPINSPNIFAAQTSKEVIEYVENTPNAIGIIGSNWLNDKRDTTNTTFKRNIRVMSVSKNDQATEMNSWKPYQAWLLNDRYPFVRTIYALLNDPRRGLPWSFAHFLENPKGQLIIFKSGLLPVKGNVVIRDVKVNDKN